MEENKTNNNAKECLSYLYNQIGRYSKTKKGYRDKLFEKGFSSVVIAEAILTAEEKRFINDDRFTENYILSNKEKKGILRIKRELTIKGVPLETIEKYLDIDQSDAALKIANKFLISKEVDYNTIGKLYRHMLGKGFTYDVISDTINKIKSTVEI